MSALIVHASLFDAPALRGRRLALQERRVQRWARQVLNALGVRLHVEGQVPAGALLLVANHVSWLDVSVLHAACGRLRFTAKSQIGQWPVLGSLARAGHTLFIEREKRRETLRVRSALREALLTGDAVAVFPEGTTGPGYPGLHWHANLLQSAIEASCVIVPVAITYWEVPAAGSALPARVFPRTAAYTDHDNLIASSWRVASMRHLVAEVHVLAPVSTQGQGRRALAEHLSEQVKAIGEQAVSGQRSPPARVQPPLP